MHLKRPGIGVSFRLECCDIFVPQYQHRFDRVSSKDELSQNCFTNGRRCPA